MEPAQCDDTKSALAASEESETWLCMTRAESDAAKKAANRKDYIRRRDKILAYQRQYAKDNREHINAMQRERRRMKSIGTWGTKKEYIRPSTDDFEGDLPLLLKVNLHRLRDEYLSIPIHQRPIYDYWLRCKTIEHCRAVMLKKRKYDHPDIIPPKHESRRE